MSQHAMRCGAAACCLAALLLAPSEAHARDLHASFAQIPNLIDSPDSGAFVELVEAIDAEYDQGAISRKMFPFARSIENVLSGSADFHIPMLRNPEVDPNTLPYRFASEPLGVVHIVLYSNAARPLTPQLVRAPLAGGGAYPYKLETLRGTPELGLPLAYSNSVEQGLQKVAAGRIDGFLMAQDEADFTVRKLRLKAIHRAHFTGFDDVIVISKGPEGDRVDAILSGAIQRMKSSGRWEALYFQVHRPYEDWQPAQAGW